MKQKKKILMVLLPIIFLIFMEGLRLHDTIKAVRVSKEIKVQKNKNLNLQKEVSREKIKLAEKMDLNTMKKYAEEEIGMKISNTINHVKIKKSVSK
ncbi:hypothetical protein [Psychrilyobacter sp.]|uniref:hypothetical protein n=1 Tax=Psychrilyobacter sp. TaxID=2586924 RepID=UPI00301A81B6